MTAGGRATLEVADVSFSYAAGRPVLRGVSLAAEAGRITLLLGGSGSGKTTLLKICKGLLPAQRGAVRVLGEPVTPTARGRLDSRVAYIPQHLGLVRNLTVLDNVLMGALSRCAPVPSLLGMLPRAETERARELIGQLGIGHKAEARAHALSGGERQRVAIARALMQEPRVVLADEFVAHLDVLTTHDMLAVVRRIADDGAAVVIATHDMDVVERHADALVVLRDGEKVLDRRARPESAADIALVLRG
jgi:phosphonate transport system ATP-binding protein